jgi:putative DNA primase/helicase
MRDTDNKSSSVAQPQHVHLDAERRRAARRAGANDVEATLPDGVARFSELGNAETLKTLHGQDLRYSAKLGWLVWDGRRWALDDDSEAARRFHDVAHAMQRYARVLQSRARQRGNTEAEGYAEAYLAWAKRSQQAKTISASLAVAATLEGIVRSPAILDTDPWLLNVRNGTLDLRTGNLRERDTRDNLTKLVSVAYDPIADCPVWRGFLTKSFAGDVDLITFVQRAIGYSLTGVTREQCFLLCWGGGANGKSTLLETVRSTVGDYAQTASADTLMAQRNGRGPENDLARLRGARFVAAAESGEGRALDEERIKRLTGGDMITARLLYREHFEFVPQFKLWLAANDRPEIRGLDHGIWRRVRLVPFRVTIPPEEQDRDLLSKLRVEAPGILRWAVDGCLAWQREGLVPPTAVAEAGAAWRTESNIVGQFVEDCCVRADRAQAKKSIVYAAYVAWSQTQGIEPMSQRMFSRRMTAMGVADARIHGGHVWCGLAVAAEQDGDA